MVYYSWKLTVCMGIISLPCLFSSLVRNELARGLMEVYRKNKYEKSKGKKHRCGVFLLAKFIFVV